MVYPSTGSLVNPNIHTGLSTQIIIKVGSATVGAIQRLTISQNRDMLIHEEIGTDGIIEIHPKNATKIDLSLTRIVFDQMRVTEAFARGFINLQAQRIPFDIHIIDKTSSHGNEDALIHIYHNCWFKNYSPTYQADNFIISENATIICERVTTNRRGLSAATGGNRGIRYDYDSIERNTDVKGIRGRLDSAGYKTKQQN